MHSTLLGVCLLLTSLLATPAQATDTPAPPDQQLQPLFQQVQRAHLFQDQKTFADAVPRQPSAAVLQAWQQAQATPAHTLRGFVDAAFVVPGEAAAYVPPPGQSLRAHIEGLWPVLTRHGEDVPAHGSLLPLPHPYVVPGGRFREVYYWDSYFTLLGLAASGRWQQVRDMVDNFAWQLDQYGHIPNGNRSYYLSRSQPPFFSLMVELLAGHEGDAAYRRYLPQLKTEHAFWMHGADGMAPGAAHERVVRLADGSTLASIQTTAIVPVDLNSLLYHLETTLAVASRADGQREAARAFQRQAQARREAINHALWDARQGWYGDRDLAHGELRPALTAAALYPLWLQVTRPAQARATATAVQAQLLCQGGLLTTTARTGQQWDAPNGWAPLQWLAVDGLQRYGQQALARQVGVRFLRTVQAVYDRQGKLVEKYVVDGSAGGGGGGEYPLQDGFGWSNGVTLALLDRLCTPHRQCDSAADVGEETP
ncbi:MAG: Periplasmic trehalase [Stenotrophomonas maltophilia]|uniref:Periplasmic trehalase n=1 Tax=Stenotrophomonas maltophilia TaxID=40324 RepID=A0A7V8JK51_STEMA|nr:MAG: Periplasmic trehalase [Stenotrophomonas maltophilia]